MTKKSKILLIAGIAALVVCVVIAAALFFFRDDAPAGPASSGETATYTVEVQSASGLALGDVGMYIYQDDTLKELVAFIKTDENGIASFTDAKLDTYVAVLDKVPTGYEAEPFYRLTGEHTQIILTTGQMTEEDMENLVYKLGDAVMDFSVTGPDGTVYTLSELFKGKKAVVLNFFYNECQPCMSEFPFLQEAYEEYKDDIAVLAMNPVNNDDEALKALIKKLGVTFPMVNCDPAWESILQITAYPTTVFIDRFGNICLIHTGAVPDAKTFKDAFAYFAAEDYEQKLFKSIEDLAVEEPEGTKENPIDVGGVTSFEVTVEPGQVVYTDLYKVKNMYLQIRNEYAYVIYNDKTYNPKNGVVGLLVSAPDTFTPATVGIGNSGKETQTFKVTLGMLAGTFNNPYTMELGEFDVDVDAGNDQGVYYVYTATEDGTLTLQCLSSTVSKYSYYLYNLSNSAMRNLEEDSQVDANGAVTVSVQAKKGQKIQVCISTLPDDSGTYPAGEFKFKATFTPGEVKDLLVDNTIEYKVTVRDDAGNPMPNISVVVKVDNEDQGFTTDQDGVALIKLLPGSYKGKIYVPEGYTAAVTEFDLTEAAPNVSLTVKKIKQANYTVKVQNRDGEALKDVLVKIGESDWLRTDDKGVATLLLNEGSYAVTIMIPAGYTGETTYNFASGATEMTITLDYPEGSEKNPCNVEQYPYETPMLSKDAQLYGLFHWDADAVALVIRDADASITLGETVYTADAEGVVTVPLTQPDLTAPALMVITNKGTNREKFTVEQVFEPGTEKNPYPVENYPYTTVEMDGSQEFWFALSLEGGKTLQIEDADAYVRIGNTTYGADVNGVVTVPVDGMESPCIVAIGNEGTAKKTFTVTLLQYALGSVNYPESITSLGDLAQLDLQQGDEDGYYYSYTCDKAGAFKLTVKNDPGVQYDIKLTAGDKEALLSESATAGEVSIEAEAGQKVVVWVSVHADTQTGVVNAASFALNAAFTPKEEPPVPGDVEYTYTVRVTDVFGAPQANIGVIFLLNGEPVANVTTDAQGVAEMYTYVLAKYTVELFFSGEGYYYDKTTAVLPVNNRDLTIKVVNHLDENDSMEIYILNGNHAYNLYVGGTHVQVSSGKPNFSAEYENNCFFTFTPTVAGTYQITASDAQTELSFWGSDWFISKQYTSKDEGRGNALTESISGTAVGNTTFVIGIKADENIKDVVLNVARIGDPAFSIADQPWTEWKTGYTHSGACNVSASGTATYFNIKAASGTYNLYYDEAAGYYRLYQNGPAVMVNLGANTNTNGSFIGLYERVNGNGQYGGAAITRYFYDSTGAFVKKENYTECFYECFACAGITAYNQTKYHPLTKDLMYALRNGFVDWWDSSSANYLPVFASANQEYAWMFACCYFQ